MKKSTLIVMLLFIFMASVTVFASADIELSDRDDVMYQLEFVAPVVESTSQIHTEDAQYQMFALGHTGYNLDIGKNVEYTSIAEIYTADLAQLSDYLTPYPADNQNEYTQVLVPINQVDYPLVE